MRPFLIRSMLVITVIATGLSARNRVLFMGITGDGAPGYSRTFEQQLRAVLDTIDEINLMSTVESNRFREMTGLDRYDEVSQGMTGRVMKLLPDTVIILWGTLENIQFTPVRKHIFGAAINGELNAELSAYSVKYRRYLFNSAVVSSITAKESPVYFSPVEKVTHLSAGERVVLTDSLIRMAVISSVNRIQSALKESDKINTEIAVENRDQKSVPSISDVFTVPSVAAPIIDRNSSPSTNSGKKSGSDTAGK
jgi:hypothetical protein